MLFNDIWSDAFCPDCPGNVIRAFRPPPGASMGRPTGALFNKTTGKLSKSPFPESQGSYAWKDDAVLLLDQLSANARPNSK